MNPESRIRESVKKLNLSNTAKTHKIYEKVLNSYYERYIKTIFGLLDPNDQTTLTDLIDRQSSESQIESFINSKLNNITQITQDSLDHFLFEYEQKMNIG